MGADWVVVVFPLGQRRPIDVEEPAELITGHPEILAQEANLVAGQMTTLLYQPQGDDSHKIVYPRYDWGNMPAPFTPNYLNSLQHGVRQPAFAELITASAYARVAPTIAAQYVSHVTPQPCSGFGPKRR